MSDGDDPFYSWFDSLCSNPHANCNIQSVSEHSSSNEEAINQSAQLSVNPMMDEEEEAAPVRTMKQTIKKTIKKKRV